MILIFYTAILYWNYLNGIGWEDYILITLLTLNYVLLVRSYLQSLADFKKIEKFAIALRDISVAVAIEEKKRKDSSI